MRPRHPHLAGESKRENSGQPTLPAREVSFAPRRLPWPPARFEENWFLSAYAGRAVAPQAVGRVHFVFSWCTAAWWEGSTPLSTPEVLLKWHAMIHLGVPSILGAANINDCLHPSDARDLHQFVEVRSLSRSPSSYCHCWRQSRGPRLSRKKYFMRRGTGGGPSESSASWTST